MNMLSIRFEWHEHVAEVFREYESVRTAVDRFKDAVAAKPDFLPKDSDIRRHRHNADKNLEGSDIIRLFAAFEAGLRSYDRARRNDPTRSIDASILIDQIGGK